MDEVQIRLYASLRTYHPGDGVRPLQVEIVPGETIRSLCQRMEIPPGEAPVIFVNHRRANPDDRLSPGDRVDLFPLVAGG